jgi:hypothetical protein
MLGRPNNPHGGCAALVPCRPGRHTSPPSLPRDEVPCAGVCQSVAAWQRALKARSGPGHSLVGLVCLHVGFTGLLSQGKPTWDYCDCGYSRWTTAFGGGRSPLRRGHGTVDLYLSFFCLYLADLGTVTEVRRWWRLRDSSGACSLAASLVVSR